MAQKKNNKNITLFFCFVLLFRREEGGEERVFFVSFSVWAFFILFLNFEFQVPVLRNLIETL